MANQEIFCRGCGQIKKVTDAELDAEWKANKEIYPTITREQTLNSMSFCSKCAGLDDETTLHVVVSKG